MTDHDVVDTLNGLIETCKDGEYGFRACAEHTKSSELREVLVRRADDCERASRELQEQVVQFGGTPDTGGSAGGALHRGWVALRGTLAGYSDQAMLDECERGEVVALAHYRRALQHALPADVRSIVEQQAHGAQHNHDQIKALRDRVRATH